MAGTVAYEEGCVEGYVCIVQGFLQHENAKTDEYRWYWGKGEREAERQSFSELLWGLNI